MSQGIIELKVKCYLSIDAEKQDVEEFIEYLKEDFIGNYDNKVYVESVDIEEEA